MTAALALAFGSGLVATINPCGFAMLPAYLSYFTGLRDDDHSRMAALRSALAVGSIVSAGFVLVFGVAGLVISAGFRTLTDWLPWMALGVGALVALLGVGMILGYEPRFALPNRIQGRRGRGATTMFGFGVSYGVASLSCTLPVFLVAVASQLTQRSVLGGSAVFLAYSAGMALMLLGVTVGVALGKQGLIRHLRASAGRINRISGVILLAAGAFIVWFWTTELTAGADALGDAALFRAVERLQAALVNAVADHLWLVAGALAAVVGGAALVTRAGRNDQDGPTRRAEPGTDVPSHTAP